MTELLGPYWDGALILLGLAAIGFVWWITDPRRHEPDEVDETGELDCEVRERPAVQPAFGSCPMRAWERRS